MELTKLNKLHKKLGAKMVDFAGYEMPVQYSSIIAEHKAVRNSVGVFDVSHMGEVFISGPKALDVVQHLTTNDASKLFPGRVQYSTMCYQNGGIVDDLLVYNLAENEYMFVINAANIEKDYKWIVENNEYGADIKSMSNDYSLFAVQGPDSEKVIQKLVSSNLDLEYYHFRQDKIADVDVILSRTGYTGEIGYELYFIGDEEDAENLWNAIFEAGKEFNIQPVGLAARDTLRLEMGFCLYGNDIDDTTNPIEAGLGWITKLKKDEFIGKDVLVKEKQEGTKRKLVALTSDERFFPRQGYEITNNGRNIGNITSGTVSPVLEKPIALGYVTSEFKTAGTMVNFLVREKEVPAEVIKLPFVKK
jgi:aminomethyltransferase